MPTTIPAHHRSQLAGLLAAAGATMVDQSDAPTIHTITCHGTVWTATYSGSHEGEPVWWLVGPAHPGGIYLDKYGIVDAVTRGGDDGRERPTCGASAVGTPIPEHRLGSPCTVDYRAI